jgi:hypothetical protein
MLPHKGIEKQNPCTARKKQFLKQPLPAFHHAIPCSNFRYAFFELFETIHEGSPSSRRNANIKRFVVVRFTGISF